MEEIINTEFLQPEAKNQLSGAGKWAKFLGICGMIYSCFIAVASLVMIFGMSSFNKILGTIESDVSLGFFSLILISLLYMCIAGVLFYMSYTAYKFGIEAKMALQNDSVKTLTSSFKNLKIFFTILGILIIVFLGLLSLALIVVLLVGFFN